MIAFRCRFSQIRVAGKDGPVDSAMQTPLALAVFFGPTVKVLWEEQIDWNEFQRAVDSAAPSRNIFHAVTAAAAFDRIRAGTVAPQRKLYLPLMEGSKHQLEFIYEGIRTTQPGSGFPDCTQGVNVAGYNVHFSARLIEGRRPRARFPDGACDHRH